MSDPALHPCFLGPYGENDALLEQLVVEFLRDHVYWRRNLHPEDPPAIPTRAHRTPGFEAMEATLRRELHALSAALKRSVPFHSQRYLGHMVSDLLLPALAAHYLTLPYNPNNVSEEAAPVTIDLELKVGLQLARMIGYVDDPSRADCAFGHLTSGGTTANFQGLRLALAMKAFPVALRAAGVPLARLPDDPQTAFNLMPAQALDLLTDWQAWLADLTPTEHGHWQHAVTRQRIETLGLPAFFARHPTLSPPRVLAPVTAHYSWSKGMKLVGLGRDALRLLPERAMRLDLDGLDTELERCLHARQPVLMVVPVLGSTEFGTIDPVDGVIAARERFGSRGLGFAVHVDAAWGGYLATLFRTADGSLRPADAMRREFTSFPTPEVHAAFAALAESDSITIDPHKLGYVPYGAGAFVCRDQRAISLLSEDADYVFDGVDDRDFFHRHRHLGRYIPEGSKPGTAAAAVYVAHRVLPLDCEHFGRLQAQTLRNREAFVSAAEAFAERMRDRLHCTIPFPPDSNLVCLALNPRGNHSVATANDFVRALLRDLRGDDGGPPQSHAFFGSATTLRPDALGAADTRRVLCELHLDPDTLADPPDRAIEAGNDRLTILRHTLMNPFLLDTENGISYIERYFDYLSDRVARLLRPSGDCW